MISMTTRPSGNTLTATSLFGQETAGFFIILHTLPPFLVLGTLFRGTPLNTSQPPWSLGDLLMHTDIVGVPSPFSISPSSCHHSSFSFISSLIPLSLSLPRHPSYLVSVPNSSQSKSLTLRVKRVVLPILTLLHDSIFVPSFSSIALHTHKFYTISIKELV